MRDYTKPQTVKQLLQWAALFLGKEKRIEAELLLARVSGYSRAKLLAYQDQFLSVEQVNEFINFIESRKAGEPLQYLLGKQNFMGLDFIVNKSVLIPRSDTEVLVEEVINLAGERKGPLKILDLCTGSGAIAVSLAKYIPRAVVFATDISGEALEVAKNNAELNKVSQRIEFFRGDLFKPVVGMDFDLIVSNPPYLSTKEMEDLPADVKKEPFIALWGGADGLEFYRKIINIGFDYLKSPGYLLVEIGWQQGEKVKNLCLTRGFSQCSIIKDWANNDRVVKAKR
ncbi:MAG: release factor glutamine methyltransferase [Clostridia bacterium]|jgi:release factor glutamine methyltransferase|nr:release factor glutamine methyltransferase [Clostridia bacterium]MDN5323800.1 release factor glutamine methyltransferase [Clostridia bacterium]